MSIELDGGFIDPAAAAIQDDRLTALNERLEAVEGFADIADRLLAVGDLRWADVDNDYRLLAINSALRRQLESISAALLHCRQDGAGHECDGPRTSVAHAWSPRRAAIARAAAVRLSSRTWPCTSLVMEIEECPSSPDTSLSGTPAASH